MTRLSALVAVACIVIVGRLYDGLSWAEVAGLAVIAGVWAEQRG